MPDHLTSRFGLRALLTAVEAAPPTAALDVLAAELADGVGARDVSFLIADFGGDAVVRLVQHAGAYDGPGQREEVQLAGTRYEQAIRTQQIQVLDEHEAARVIAPVTDRGDAIGVLELVLPNVPDRAVVDYLAAAAHALAYVVIANRRFTDLYERGRRTRPLTLAAEIQHRLLPDCLTCEAGQFTVAGALEPTSEIGGDTFDYSLDHDTLHLSLTDAVGHAEEAALLSTLLVGSLRNTRRRGADLAEQAALANQAIAAHGAGEHFATGQLLRVDLATGAAGIVNAGHLRPLHVRGSHVETIDLVPDLPFGVLAATRYEVQRFTLQPGDRIVLVTDGMTERKAARVDIEEILIDSRHLHPREAVRELTRAVMRATGGRLRDDATVLCLDWHDGDQRTRNAAAGASQSRASS